MTIVHTISLTPCKVVSFCVLWNTKHSIVGNYPRYRHDYVVAQVTTTELRLNLHFQVQNSNPKIKIETRG